jgi:hypothetical protein
MSHGARKRSVSSIQPTVARKKDAEPENTVDSPTLDPIVPLGPLPEPPTAAHWTFDTSRLDVKKRSSRRDLLGSDGDVGAEADGDSPFFSEEDWGSEFDDDGEDDDDEDADLDDIATLHLDKYPPPPSPAPHPFLQRSSASCDFPLQEMNPS